MSQQLIVRDTTPPQIVVPHDRVIEASLPLTHVELGEPIVLDAVDLNPQVISSDEGPFALGRHQVVWSVTDMSGNTSTGTQNITVQDTTKPVLLIPSDMEISVAINEPVSISMPNAVAFDAFPVTVSNDAPELFPIGVSTIIWKAVDANGNEKEQQQIVTAHFDDIAPVVTAPQDISISTSEKIVYVDLGLGLANDNRDGYIPTFPDPGGPFVPGVHQVSWNAADSAGNAGNDIQQVNISSTMIDIDRDGIDDNWELNRYGNLNQEILQTDVDVNGFNDIDDYINQYNTGAITTQVTQVQLLSNTSAQLNLFDNILGSTVEDLVLLSVGVPKNGEVIRQLHDNVIYQPRHNYHGSDYFEYLVRNVDGDIAIGYVWLIITPSDDIDTDGDSINDAIDPDDDNDGMPDVFEVRYWLDPLNSLDAATDNDNDNETPLDEYHAGTNPNDDLSNSKGNPYPLYKLLANDTKTHDYFGRHVAIHGDVALVSAKIKDVSGFASGAAYIFVKDAKGIWAQQARLIPDDGDESDMFGASVALSDEYAVIGATGDNGEAGSVYVFRKNTDTEWVQQAKLQPEFPVQHGIFGRSVAIFGDTIVIGELGDTGLGAHGTVYVFEKNAEDNWVKNAELANPEVVNTDTYGVPTGYAENIDIYDGTILVGSSDYINDLGVKVGGVHVFSKNESGDWAHEAILTADDASEFQWFGYDVSLDGETAIIGAHGDDTNGENSGAAYVFTKNGASQWIQQTKIVSDVTVSGDFFGMSVALSGNVALVGAMGDDSNGNIFSGTAYLVTSINSADAWDHIYELDASDLSKQDYYGRSLALSGSDAVIGSYGDTDGGHLSGSIYMVNLDNDIDGLLNDVDVDDDNDGLLDIYETNTNIYFTATDTGSNPFSSDTDSDGYADGEEVSAGSDPNDINSVPYLADGDVNRDGGINVGDLLLVQRYVLGITDLSIDQIRSADLYPAGEGDGKVTMSDFILLQKMLLAVPE